MQCPSCKTAMKPLFMSWFCPRDCDKRSSGMTTSREFVLKGRRWRGTIVKKISGTDQKNYWLLHLEEIKE